ncbi:MAG: hypothetical protein QJR05_01665 [Thermoanaerobacterium sp.]|nr:hypothetical protein [Thermoanaerobacterium sp.]
MEKVYETERLVLRVLDKTYAELVLDYYLRNRTFLQEWEPLRDEILSCIELKQISCQRISHH